MTRTPFAVLQSSAEGGFSCERKAGATLKRSTVTGNSTAPECGVSRICADVVTCNKRPRVKPGSTCGTSANLGTAVPGTPWGVCTLD